MPYDKRTDMNPVADPLAPHLSPPFLALSALFPCKPQAFPHPAFSAHSKSSLLSSWNLMFGGRSS